MRAPDLLFKLHLHYAFLRSQHLPFPYQPSGDRSAAEALQPARPAPHYADPCLYLRLHLFDLILLLEIASLDNIYLFGIFYRLHLGDILRVNLQAARLLISFMNAVCLYRHLYAC